MDTSGTSSDSEQTQVRNNFGDLDNLYSLDFVEKEEMLPNLNSETQIGLKIEFGFDFEAKTEKN